MDVVEPYSLRVGCSVAILKSSSKVLGVLTLISVIGAAFSTTKYQLLAFRILLGLGMGAKASVVPIYAGRLSLFLSSDLQPLI